MRRRHAAITGERVGGDALLRELEGHHLGVQRAVVEPHDHVHADADELAGAALEDRGSERPARPALDVLLGEADSQLHAVLVGRVRYAEIDPLRDP